MHLQLAILKGDMVIEVDEEEQQFLVGEREPHHGKIYPQVIDFIEFFGNKQAEMDRILEAIEMSLDQLPII